MCLVLQEFVPVARELEKNWTRFSPHYIVWVCPLVYRQSAECQSQCIHQGRYCTPDPDGDLENGYSGADVVQVCVMSDAANQAEQQPMLLNGSSADSSCMSNRSHVSISCPARAPLPALKSC